jgi:hypothetical protein
LALSEPSEDALAYAETMIENYEEDDEDDEKNDGNLEKELLK